jgi:hypothetical protein
MSQSRRLAAILAADIAGYSALMGSDEARTVSDLKGHQAVVLPMVSDFGGRVIDTAGDGILAEFPSVLNAVECAVAIQRKMIERNTAIEPERRMEFRIGINLGDVKASPSSRWIPATWTRRCMRWLFPMLIRRRCGGPRMPLQQSWARYSLHCQALPVRPRCTHDWSQASRPAVC